MHINSSNDQAASDINLVAPEFNCVEQASISYRLPGVSTVMFS